MLGAISRSGRVIPNTSCCMFPRFVAIVALLRQSLQVERGHIAPIAPTIAAKRSPADADGAWTYLAG